MSSRWAAKISRCCPLTCKNKLGISPIRSAFKSSCLRLKSLWGLHAAIQWATRRQTFAEIIIFTESSWKHHQRVLGDTLCFYIGAVYGSISHANRFVRPKMLIFGRAPWRSAQSEPEPLIWGEGIPLPGMRCQGDLVTTNTPKGSRPQPHTLRCFEGTI